MHGYSYLCSPYTHPDPSVRASRYEAACKAAAKLLLRGEAVFAPIPHSHPIEQHFPKPEGFDFWMHVDLPLVARAEKLIVLKLDGWDTSRGVQREMEYARENGIPIQFMEPDA